MKAGKRSGGLFGLLVRHDLLFTVSLLALVALTVLAWNARLNALFRPPDWGLLLADPALAEGRYEALRARARDLGDYAVYDETGALLYATAADFDPAITAGERDCIPVYGTDVLVSAYTQTDESGRTRQLLVRQTGTPQGDQVRFAALDTAGRVVWGGLGDGRTAYTDRELAYLTGARFAGCQLYRAPVPGTENTILLREREMDEAESLRRYALAQQVWLPFVPLLALVTGVSVWLLRRRIAGPLRQLDAAVEALSAGRSARVGVCGGPREIRRIGETFDRFARRLEASEAERRRMDAARQKMIADISHDIKTPVTVICGGIDAICDGKVPPDQVERTLRMVRRRADTLAQLADSFHEYGKVEHPQFTLRPVRTDAGEFLRAYLAAKYDEIELAGFALEVDIPETPLWCQIDPLQMTRALDNLVTNALRYNRLGTMLFVTARIAGEKAEIRIADNGAGIPAARRAHIFEPFVTGSDTRSTPGSGLGLSIARRIVEKHGGTIRLTDAPAPPRVTEFCITLPLAGPAQP